MGNLQPMTPEMASLVFPDKYRDVHVHSYWDYLIRGVQRAGLDHGMPEREMARA